MCKVKVFLSIEKDITNTEYNIWLLKKTWYMVCVGFISLWEPNKDKHI